MLAVFSGYVKFEHAVILSYSILDMVPILCSCLLGCVRRPNQIIRMCRQCFLPKRFVKLVVNKLVKNYKNWLFTERVLHIYMYIVYLSFPFSCIVLCGNITTCNALLHSDLIYLWPSCMCNVHVPVHSVRVLIFLFFFFNT